jgi:hypothetical protein
VAGDESWEGGQESGGRESKSPTIGMKSGVVNRGVGK